MAGRCGRRHGGGRGHEERARHARQPLSREKLMELARGREYEVFDRSLDVQISRLRKLIEPDPSSPLYIQTVWGVGYRWETA